ncbi:MAG: putative phospholipid-binding protein MlaC precursor, partial [Pseudomonadota bacterium]
MKNTLSLAHGARRFFLVLVGLGLAALGSAQAADEAADVFIKRMSTETLDTIKSDRALRNGDVNKIIALVDSKVMPNVNFRRMTALATGPAWRKATPEQQKRLQEEFKLLLVRTYSGALSQV